jgi:hypothetical protein
MAAQQYMLTLRIFIWYTTIRLHQRVTIVSTYLVQSDFLLPFPFTPLSSFLILILILIFIPHPHPHHSSSSSSSSSALFSPFTPQLASCPHPLRTNLHVAGTLCALVPIPSHLGTYTIYASTKSSEKIRRQGFMSTANISLRELRQPDQESVKPVASMRLIGGPNHAWNFQDAGRD